MKIFLLIFEVLFTGFMIYRLIRRIKVKKCISGAIKLCSFAVALCVVNLITIVGNVGGVGYIYDMFFLGVVVIELLFGNL